MEKRISKFIKIICLVTLFLGLTATAHASPESQDLVAQGRALLFNNGEPTYSGMLSANEKFEAAVQADSTDQKANLFYAVTRILAFALEQGSGPVLETLRDLLEAFGMARNENDSIEESPYNDSPEIHDQYVPPDTIPGGEAVRAFAAGPFVGLLDEAIANLAAIDDSLDITLTADETGDEEVEVDYGDVLVLKSALYTLKTFFLMVTAYDLDVDLRELMVLGNAGVLQIQRDLLDQYENFLSLRGDGAASLTDARQALLDGINAYRQAFNFITSEEDDKEDDLFYFESDGDVREADFLLTQLTELQNSLDENRPATFTVIEERWILTDGNGKRLQMEIEKDADGNFLTGEVWGLDGCEFLFCGGWVEKFTVSGTNDVTIAVACGGWCPGSATLTATLSGNEIINGTFDATNCERSWGGTFTGQRVDTETETEIIDFNRIFGNTDKPPLDIRAVLPAFDQYSEPVPGTFPGAPVLNGILPGIQTNDDLTRELNLQPSGYFDIPTAAITIDGSPSDWPMETLLHTDISGDDDPDLSGTDIEKVYLAQDSTNLYIAMTLHDNDPNTDGNTYYGLQLRYPRKSDCDIQMDTVYDQGEWVVTVQRGPRWGWQTINTYSSGYAAEGTRFIEWKVPFSDIQPAIGTLNGKFVTTEIFAASYGESPERNNTKIQLNTSEVSGTVDCPAHTSGNIFIYAFDGPDPNTANLLGATYISEPGDYTIAGLPIGVDVYVVGLWDADFNGVLTFGDYLGGSDPATVAGDGSTVVNIEPSTLYAAGEGMPYFGYSNVMAMNTPDGIQTALTTQVFDSNGTVPGTINTFTVVGPGDFAYSFTDDDYVEGFNVYWHEIPGQPVEGEYTFTVTDNEGKTAVSYSYLEVGDTIPLPDISSFQASGDPLVPNLSWGAVSGYEGNLFYRARIFDMDFNIIWTSWFTTESSVNVPPGILGEGTQYQWRVEAFDNYTFVASYNRAVSQIIPLTIDNSQPYFKHAVVYNNYDPSGFYTALDVWVVDPNGTLPDSISSITVTGPGVFSYLFQPEDYDPFWQSYYHKIPGRPADGIYTFTVLDTEGNMATSYDYVAAHDIPRVDSSTLQASGDPMTPTLSWGAPALMERSYYFRAIIEDLQGNRVWASGRIAETAIEVPSGELQADGSYKWYVRTTDDNNWIHFSNQSRSVKINLDVTGASKPYFKWATIYKRHDPSGTVTAMDVSVFDPNDTVPDSIVSLTVTGPGGFSQDLRAGDYSPADSAFYLQIPGAPSEGVYTFTLEDNEGNTSITHDYVQAGDDIPLIDESSILVSGNPLAPTVSWAGISGYPGHLYYRMRVYDDQWNQIYRTSREPSTARTIPQGYIQDGNIYFVRIEAHDHRHWVIYNSRTNSDRVIWLPPGTVVTSVSGTVTDSLGNSIPNVHVYAQSWACGGEWLGGTNTDSNGEYTLYNLPQGDVYVRACPDCSDLDVNYVDEWYDDVSNCSDASPVWVTEGQDTPGINFTLEIGGTISGHVYEDYEDDDTTPISNVHVYAEDYNSHEWVAGTNTDQDGTYTLVLPSGSYGVRACASCSDLSYADEYYQDASWENASEVPVTSPDDTPDIDFTLTPLVKRDTIEEAINDGLAWLAGEQNPDGSWGTQYALAKTSLAVLSFETYAKDQGLSPFDTAYQYHTQVENGLDYIFANAYTTGIGVQLAGDPDGDGDGIGVYFNMPPDWHTTYYTSIAMMAIAASNAPDRVVSVTGSLVDGLTYQDVLQDMMDYLAWGQTDAGNGRGGWNYGATNNDNTRSDQSNTGWVTLALAYAEADPPEGFGLTIPGFVRTELGFWINFIQDDVDDDDNDGGSYYDGSSGDGTNMLRTGNLLQQMAFVGDTGTTQRVQDAIDYMVRHWEGGWNWDPICYQATYTTMKGLEALGVETIDAINWFQDFSDAIRSEQSIHGWWPICCFDDGEKILSTEWAIMTLQKTIPPTEENPDLEVIKSEQWVDEANGTYTVSYTIKNRGNIEAPAGHVVGLTIDGADVEQKAVPVTLAPGSSYSDSFETTLSGVRDEITVCADINGEVDELNEANNCATNIWPPPIKGDLSGDRNVDLADAILALQVLVGLNPEGVDLGADVDGDGKIGLAELIYILQTVAHLR